MVVSMRPCALLLLDPHGPTHTTTPGGLFIYINTAAKPKDFQKINQQPPEQPQDHTTVALAWCLDLNLLAQCIF